MRRLICLLTLLPAACVFAAPLTQGERDRALSELHATRKQFLDAIADLTPAQWNFKPSEAVWSVAECAEHIAVSEDALFELVTKKIMASPADPSGRERVKGKDEAVLKGVADRSQKAMAPEFLVPTHRWPTPEALTSHFRQSRDRTIEYIKTTQDDLRDHFAPHPAMQELDAYQWILLIAAHSGRHVRQIDEVKGSPNFPRP